MDCSKAQSDIRAAFCGMILSFCHSKSDPFARRELETAARRAHLLLSDACSTDKSPEPGSGHLSCSDEESQPIENTIQLAWRPSFADEYKRLFATMDVEDTLLKAADQGR